MLQEAASEEKLFEGPIAELHPKYGTPVRALIIQAIVVSIFCFSTFASPTVAAAYWTLTALTTICYFIPYLLMFPAYLRLRRIHPEVPRSFRIPGRILPILLPVLGWCSILFAVMLLFISPAGLDLGGYGLYVAKIVGGALLALLTAQWTYRHAMKRRAALKKN